MERQFVYLIAFVLLTVLTVVNLLRYRREKAGKAAAFIGLRWCFGWRMHSSIFSFCARALVYKAFFRRRTILWKPCWRWLFRAAPGSVRFRNGCFLVCCSQHYFCGILLSAADRDSERVAEDRCASGSRLAVELADLLCVLWPAGLGGDDRFSDLGTALRAVYENAAKAFGARMQ